MQLSLWLSAKFDDILRHKKVSHALTRLEEKPNLAFFLRVKKEDFGQYICCLTAFCTQLWTSCNLAALGGVGEE